MGREFARELSVVIPALDEAQALPGLLDQLADQRDVDLEIVVADGGSKDATRELARQSGARVVEAPRGRGAQMNAGARAASGEFLLFLHADSKLPSNDLLVHALAAQRDVLAREPGGRVAGHFPLRFERVSADHGFFFRNMEEKTATNRRDTINGDQAVLISASYFAELGGFDEQLPFLEDQRLAARIFDSGRWIVLPGHLVTSARRFESQGHHRLYTLMAIIMGMHAAGVEPFFERAPRVYAEQARADGLDVRPYLILVREILIQAGWRGAAGIAFRVGCYVRRQSWQPFFWLDAWLRPWIGEGRHPALRFHDRVFEPLTAHRWADALVATAVPLWFLCILPAGYAAADLIRRLRHRFGPTQS